jgi:long-chain acyl-CoA synthetase
VSCAEVEAAIYELDGVAEAAVSGLPDARLGERVVAVVVPEQGVELVQGDVSEHLEGRLSGYKVPTTICVRNEPLPRNANGKFLKRELRDMYGA